MAFVLPRRKGSFTGACAIDFMTASLTAIMTVGVRIPIGEFWSCSIWYHQEHLEFATKCQRKWPANSPVRWRVGPRVITYVHTPLTVPKIHPSQPMANKNSQFINQNIVFHLFLKFPVSLQIARLNRGTSSLTLQLSFPRSALIPTFQKASQVTRYGVEGRLAVQEPNESYRPSTLLFHLHLSNHLLIESELRSSNL
ncbi:hypothetical protein NPIL_360131 [Nephila pilipes]|uniref:Uncharacterized protein n=1 Tax=Nephila pilipes TaxID=299642 RepID=A0A8X6QF91_NEPPI|nr:hypothetical protein NPIL_360131 [Nephila pilipes]